MFKPRSANDASSIDEFLLNAFSINRIYARYTEERNLEFPRELGGLVVLGYVSATESYFRSIFRRLTHIDERCRIAQYDKQLRFAAAIHHSEEMLPEALLEHISFINRDSVANLWTELGGAKKLPRQLEDALVDYAKLCEIRHCCVHRFGRLGLTNAARMGLDQHKGFLEGPFQPTVEDIEELAVFTISFVKTFNATLFRQTLETTVAAQYQSARMATPYSWTWTWDFRRDRARFSRYYDAFAVKSSRPASPSLSEVYASFRKDKQPGQSRR